MLTIDALNDMLIETEKEVKELQKYGANTYGLGYVVGRRDLLLEMIEIYNEE